MIPLTVPEIRRLLAGVLQRSHPPGHTARWLNWRRRHQARSRWFHQRTRLNRNNALVSQTARHGLTRPAVSPRAGSSGP